MDRRYFLQLAGAASVSLAAFTPELQSRESSPIRGVAFDAFVIFNPGSVALRAEEVFPGKGNALVTEWRTRQFEYSWIRTSAMQYRDFWHVTEEALSFAARKLQLDLTPGTQKRLMDAYLELEPWSDVESALKQLRHKNIRLAFLSNFTAHMLGTNLKTANLREYFEDHFTTDRVQAFKPSPRAYQMGLDGFGLKRNEIAFAAFAGWDAAGAKWFGYPTIWVNRGGAATEQLGVSPDVVAKGMDELLKFVG